MTAPLVRVIATASLLLGQSACMVLGSRKSKLPELGDHLRARGHVDKGLIGPALGPKPVRGKEPPTRLLARDGSSCIVSRQKFEQTTIGTSIWCVWTDTNR